MGRLRERAEQEPLVMTAIILLFSAGLVMLPYDTVVSWVTGAEATVTQKLAVTAIARFVCAAVGVGLALGCGFRDSFLVRSCKWLLALPLLLIAVGNFPIFPLAQGSATLTADSARMVAFCFQCVGVALFEEIMFRGIAQKLLLRKFGNTRRGALIAIVAGSALFGLMHLINLTGGAAVGAVMLQVLYTTTLGALFGVCAYVSGNIYVGVAVHALFNFGGQIVEYCGVGTTWTAAGIVLMVVVSVIVAAYALFLFLRATRRKEANPDTTESTQSVT